MRRARDTACLPDVLRCRNRTCVKPATPSASGDNVSPRDTELDVEMLARSLTSLWAVRPWGYEAKVRHVASIV